MTLVVENFSFAASADVYGRNFLKYMFFDHANKGEISPYRT